MQSQYLQGLWRFAIPKKVVGYTQKGGIGVPKKVVDNFQGLIASMTQAIIHDVTTIGGHYGTKRYISCKA